MAHDFNESDIVPTLHIMLEEPSKTLKRISIPIDRSDASEFSDLFPNTIEVDPQRGTISPKLTIWVTAGRKE